MRLTHLVICLGLAAASNIGCQQQEQRIQELEKELATLKSSLSAKDSTIAALEGDLRTARTRFNELLKMSTSDTILFDEIRRSNREVGEAVRAMQDEPRICFDNGEMAKGGVRFKPTGKHMEHLEKKIVALLKELDRARVAQEKPTATV